MVIAQGKRVKNEGSKWPAKQEHSSSQIGSAFTQYHLLGVCRRRELSDFIILKIETCSFASSNVLHDEATNCQTKRESKPQIKCMSIIQRRYFARGRERGSVCEDFDIIIDRLSPLAAFQAAFLYNYMFMLRTCLIKLEVHT
jgi:hypothetical protein